ncbi:MAG: hypothetical protein WA659_06005 [Candidatus Aquirickettsiella sp.]
MHPIYFVTLKNPKYKDQSENQDYKLLVIKNHNFNKIKKIFKGTIAIEEIADNENYVESDKDLLFFKIVESQSKDFQKYINKNLINFLENNNIDKQSINNFIKFLEADQDYYFEAVTSIEKEDKLLIEAIANSLPSSPIMSRPSSERYERTSENASLRKTLSFDDLPKENSTEIPRIAIFSDLSSSHNSVQSQDSFENAERAQLIDGAQKIRSFFTEKGDNTNLVKMERHGSNIKNSYFNGNEKSKVLSEITNLAADLKDSCKEITSKTTSEGLVSLDEKFSKFKDSINDKQNLETLSRYRGFSAFKCFATLWGGGKVKSIEYVNELRAQIDTLTKEIAPIRPTV